jgi:hypothetical protein
VPPETAAIFQGDHGSFDHSTKSLRDSPLKRALT